MFTGIVETMGSLMKIKSQLLLPREITDEGAEEDLDPRADLVRRLLEYQQFKEIAEWLGDQAYHQRDVFRNRPSVETDTDGAELHPVSLFDLLKALTLQCPIKIGAKTNNHSMKSANSMHV